MNNETFVLATRAALNDLRLSQERCRALIAAQGSLYHKWFIGKLTAADFGGDANELTKFTNAIAAFQAIDTTYDQQVGAIIPVAR